MNFYQFVHKPGNLDNFVKLIEKLLIDVIDKEQYDKVHNKNDALATVGNGLGKSSEFVLRNKRIFSKIHFDLDIQERANFNRNSKNPTLRDLLNRTKGGEMSLSIQTAPKQHPFKRVLNSPMGSDTNPTKGIVAQYQNKKNVVLFLVEILQ